MSYYCYVVMQRQLEGNIPDDQLWDSSSYLVESVFQTLRKMFTNAREIQVMMCTHLHYSCLGLDKFFFLPILLFFYAR